MRKVLKLYLRMTKLHLDDMSYLVERVWSVMHDEEIESARLNDILLNMEEDIRLMREESDVE